MLEEDDFHVFQCSVSRFHIYLPLLAVWHVSRFTIIINNTVPPLTLSLGNKGIPSHVVRRGEGEMRQGRGR